MISTNLLQCRKIRYVSKNMFPYIGKLILSFYNYYVTKYHTKQGIRSQRFISELLLVKTVFRIFFFIRRKLPISVCLSVEIISFHRNLISNWQIDLKISLDFC